MKNNIYSFLFIFFLNYFAFLFSAQAEQFNFDVTELEILENGNIIKGLKKGNVKTDDGITIYANTFIYNKKLNTLEAIGNVSMNDVEKDVKLFANKIIYNKDKEIIKTIDNSKAIYNKSKFIQANSFNYKKAENILIADGNVRAEDKIKNYILFAENLTYDKNLEKISTVGKTKSLIKSKFEVNTNDIIFLINENNLSSKSLSEIKDTNSNVYKVSNFKYSIEKEILKGEDILIITNYNLPKSDSLFFANAIIDFKNQEFIGKNIDIRIHKEIFDRTENDPRLKGASASGNDSVTTINKGIFTSCKENDNCPPWSIKAEKIKHDKINKQLIYENAILEIYDKPILYFPKFFHPDPSVERQSGFLKPELNNSNALGSSFTLPYFKVLADNKDLTFVPTIFDSDKIMTNFEYRQSNKNSNFIADFGVVNNYKSPTTKKKSNLTHLFAEFKSDLKLENFLSSELTATLERVTNDTYLKIFNSHITKSKVRPNNFDKLNNNIKVYLTHENFNFESGIETYETLKESKSDRYQYILPYYNFDRSIPQNILDGNLQFYSSGSNDLNNTNNLKTLIINDITYQSESFVSDFGLKTNFNLDFKNLNSVGKKDAKYKSSPQMELISLFNVDLSLPLIKYDKYSTNFLTPKMSFRLNPSDMKNYSNSNNKIDVNNIFAVNRLGFSDTFETGKSITLGLDFKKEKSNDLNQINKYFELKLATVFRDEEEISIPSKSTLNKKNTNLFGSINSKMFDNIEFEYNFSLDNDYKTFEYNDLGATLSINNIVTSFNFIEEDGDVGDTNVLQNSITYNYDDNNLITFKTRRNRKINLTEYYDLVYEYKNDCLTAGIKYNKTYYSDGDLKPSENLMFSITLFPLTTYEYKANELLEN